MVADDPLLILSLGALKQKCCADSFVVQVFYNMFYRRLAAILVALGLGGLLTPSSFRAGGATWLWLATQGFHGLRLRGKGVTPHAPSHITFRYACAP